MYRLLNIEFQKLRCSRIFKLFSLAYFVILSCIALFALVKFRVAPDLMEISLADEGIFEFPIIWHVYTWVAALLKIFLTIIIITSITNEYQYRTLKQNLVDGLSKKEFLLSKILGLLSFAFISTLFVFVISIVLGLSYSSDTSISVIFEGTEYLLAYFVKLVTFLSLCLFIAFLIKKSAFSLFLLFIWWIAEKIIGGVESLVSDVRIGDGIYALSDYLPLEAMGNLIKQPFTRFDTIRKASDMISGQTLNIDYSVDISFVFTCIIYTFVFILLSFLILKRQDL